jgi:hypothetical protein
VVKFRFLLLWLLLVTDYLNSDISWFFSLSGFMVIAWSAVVDVNAIRAAVRRIPGPAWAMIALAAVTMLRTNDETVKTWVLIARPIKLVFFIVLSFAVFNRRRSISFVLLMPFVFIALNLILYYAAADIFDNERLAPRLGESVTLYLFGIRHDRVNFPLVNGMNNYGVYVGAVLAMAVGALRRWRAAVWMVAACLVSLFLIDHRTAILCAVMAAIAAYVLNHRAKLSTFATVLCFAAPLLILMNTFLLPANNITDAISRSSDDLDSGNGRMAIWGTCLMHLSRFEPIQLIGYGEYGQIGSGLVNNWAGDFAATFSSNIISTHNALLQYVLDEGYIGLLLTVIFTAWLASKSDMIGIAFYLYYALVGVTESHQIQMTSLTLFWFITAHTLSHDKTKTTRPVADHRLSISVPA